MHTHLLLVMFHLCFVVETLICVSQGDDMPAFSCCLFMIICLLLCVSSCPGAHVSQREELCSMDEQAMKAERRHDAVDSLLQRFPQHFDLCLQSYEAI